MWFSCIHNNAMDVRLAKTTFSDVGILEFNRGIMGWQLVSKNGTRNILAVYGKKERMLEAAVYHAQSRLNDETDALAQEKKKTACARLIASDILAERDELRRQLAIGTHIVSESAESTALMHARSEILRLKAILGDVLHGSRF